MITNEQSGNILLWNKLTTHYVILANYSLLSNLMHTVLVITDVSNGRYQLVTLKSVVLLGE